MEILKAFFHGSFLYKMIQNAFDQQFHKTKKMHYPFCMHLHEH
jgi:hypothetical protein